jgi:hypothetical protein
VESPNFKCRRQAARVLESETRASMAPPGPSILAFFESATRGDAPAAFRKRLVF